MKKSNRLALHAKYGERCAYCGTEITLRQMQADHIVPRIAGGPDDLFNRNPACGPCNNLKFSHSVETFRREIAAQVRRARDYSVNFRTAERFGMIRVIEKPVVFYFERTDINPDIEK